MDRHARTTPLERNVPVLLALIGIWNYNLLGAQSHAVLAYDRRLRLLPSYLQQLEMESNGKSTRVDGSAVDLQTMPTSGAARKRTASMHSISSCIRATGRSASSFVGCIEAAHPYGDHHR